MRVVWIVSPFKFFLLIYNPSLGQVRPPPAVQLPKQYVCRGSVGLTRYTSVSTTTWSLCGWATRNWQSKGTLKSVKNCSRDVLVSRNSSQMALDEYVSTKACENILHFLCLSKCLLLSISRLVLLMKLENILFRINEYLCWNVEIYVSISLFLPNFDVIKFKVWKSYFSENKIIC